MTAPTFYPYFRYDDAKAAIDWLVETFGFQAELVVDAPDGSVPHAQLSFGGGMFLLGSSSDDERSASQVPAVTGGIYVYVADPDSHHARAVKAGATITRPPYDTEYGSREYSVHDLEGHHWSFGTYRPTPAS